MFIVYDNLSKGYVYVVKWGFFEVGDIVDGERLNDVICCYDVCGVIYLVLFIEVSELVVDFFFYYYNNVVNMVFVFN